MKVDLFARNYVLAYLCPTSKQVVIEYPIIADIDKAVEALKGQGCTVGLWHKEDWENWGKPGVARWR